LSSSNRITPFTDADANARAERHRTGAVYVMGVDASDSVRTAADAANTDAGADTPGGETEGGAMSVSVCVGMGVDDVVAAAGESNGATVGNEMVDIDGRRNGTGVCGERVASDLDDDTKGCNGEDRNKGGASPAVELDVESGV
jgi:hypothetical protein